ncbi:hypothetical protein Hanom_Chr02g00170061 [Helianthus anomalus]
MNKHNLCSCLFVQLIKRNLLFMFVQFLVRVCSTYQTKFLVRVCSFVKHANINELPAKRFTNSVPFPALYAMQFQALHTTNK